MVLWICGSELFQFPKFAINSDLGELLISELRRGEMCKQIPSVIHVFIQGGPNNLSARLVSFSR